MEGNKKVAVLAFFKLKASAVKEGEESPIIAATKEMIEETLKEAGCIKYALHKDLDDPLRYTMIEEWETLEHLMAHAKSSHVAAGRAKMQDLLESPAEVRKYTAA